MERGPGCSDNGGEVRRRELGIGDSNGGRQGVHAREEKRQHPFIGDEQCVGRSRLASKQGGKEDGGPNHGGARAASPVGGAGGGRARVRFMDVMRRGAGSKALGARADVGEDQDAEAARAPCGSAASRPDVAVPIQLSLL
jgi:hypothetical protein